MSVVTTDLHRNLHSRLNGILLTTTDTSLNVNTDLQCFPIYLKFTNHFAGWSIFLFKHCDITTDSYNSIQDTEFEQTFCPLGMTMLKYRYVEKRIKHQFKKKKSTEKIVLLQSN